MISSRGIFLPDNILSKTYKRMESILVFKPLTSRHCRSEEIGTICFGGFSTAGHLEGTLWQANVSRHCPVHTSLSPVYTPFLGIKGKGRLVRCVGLDFGFSDIVVRRLEASRGPSLDVSSWSREIKESF